MAWKPASPGFYPLSYRFNTCYTATYTEELSASEGTVCCSCSFLLKAQFAEQILRNLPVGRQGAGVPFLLRDARSAHRGIAISVVTASPFPQAIIYSSSQWSPEQLDLVRVLLTHLLHHSNARQEAEKRSMFYHQHHSWWNSTHWNVPMAIILAQSILSPLCNAEAGKLCSYTQPRAACSSAPLSTAGNMLCISANSQPPITYHTQQQQGAMDHSACISSWLPALEQLPCRRQG